jgi:hypothetical protein
VLEVGVVKLRTRRRDEEKEKEKNSMRNDIDRKKRVQFVLIVTKHISFTLAREIA